jgi:segregation and condensation protein A
MQEKIFNLIMEQEEVGWKTILYDLVKSEEMNPWDVNISLITKKYIELVKKMKEHDLKVSGKVLLAAAVLLKIKSNHLIDHDISKLDALLHQGEELVDDDMLEEFEDALHKHREKDKFQLIPRQPQPRSRKVSIHDLVEALQRAMESKRRILAKKRPVKYQMPKRHMDIMEVISDIYHKIVYYSKKDSKKKLTFSQLLPPNASKQEKVFTFLPLLHLENQRRVETEQKKPFEEINVKILAQKSKRSKAKSS